MTIQQLFDFLRDFFTFVVRECPYKVNECYVHDVELRLGALKALEIWISQ